MRDIAKRRHFKSSEALEAEERLVLSDTMATDCPYTEIKK